MLKQHRHRNTLINSSARGSRVGRLEDGNIHFQRNVYSFLSLYSKVQSSTSNCQYMAGLGVAHDS